MKNIFCKLSVFAVAAVLLSGCPTVPPRGFSATVFSSHFIPAYRHISNIGFGVDSNAITIIASEQLDEVNIFSKGEDKILFDSLAARYGDLGYDAELTYHDNGYEGAKHARYFYNYAMTENISSIEVTSLNAWDDAHPYGKSLNDIIYVRAVTPIPFITSGYSADVPRLTEFSKRLSEMSPEDFRLTFSNLEPYESYGIWYNDDDFFRLMYVNLIFDHKPTIDKSQTLRVKVVLDNGCEYRMEQRVDFR